tara:strand:+ start:115 stop:756 length:642 start_codon:yes stop_codon:yes gene_type:complete
MKLYLVRHAKSKKNAGQKSGVNSELHGDGIEQAKRLGKYFHNVKLDKVYCSTMKRAKATLQAIKPYIENVPFSYSDKIKEHNIGIYASNGKDDWSQLRKDAIKNGESFVEFKPSKGDSLEETYKRAGNFYKKLLKKHKNDKILIVAHAIFLKYLIFNILDISDLEEGKYWKLSNAGVSTFIINTKGKVDDYHIDDFHHLIEGGMKIKKATGES